MPKQHNANWAEEMFMEKPPVRYSPTVLEAFALAGMEDPLKTVSAAYNYGFIRGQRYEKARAKKARKA